MFVIKSKAQPSDAHFRQVKLLAIDVNIRLKIKAYQGQTL